MDPSLAPLQCAVDEAATNSVIVDPAFAPEGPSDRPVAGVLPARQAAATATFYRTVWRWHFYAGLFVSPFLITLAVTGALYIFRNDIEEWFYRDMMFVPAAAGARSYEAQTVAAIADQLDGEEARLVIYEDADRATEVTMYSESAGYRRVFVDPRDARVLGEAGDGGFFNIVLSIHRNLFVGVYGRIVVELVTCWTIILLATGLFLWWPESLRRLPGTWLPRLSAKPYTVLRDLHAVAGVYVAVVALAITLSGLIYTQVWGTGYFLAARSGTGVAQLLAPPKSKSAQELPTLALEKVVALSREHCPYGSVSILLPKEPQDAFVCTYWGDDRPVSHSMVVLDRATGETLLAQRTDELPALAWWSRWNYAVHVGSLLGGLTRWLWLLASVLLASLPITGVWMWWRRRPAGRTGFPRRLPARSPRGTALLLTGLGVCLPIAGLSLLVIFGAERIVRRLRRNTTSEQSN